MVKVTLLLYIEFSLYIFLLLISFLYILTQVLTFLKNEDLSLWNDTPPLPTLERKALMDPNREGENVHTYFFLPHLPPMINETNIRPLYYV